jgi:hypothetical protein
MMEGKIAGRASPPQHRASAANGPSRVMHAGGGTSGACRIPLPAPTERLPAAGAPDAGGRLVAAFLDATSGLSCDAAAALAGVRPGTIRNWRRRLPRWLNAGIATRLRAHLTGEIPDAPDAGFRKAFRQRLRATPATGG